MMTLYRTPNVIVDRHEWHAVVQKHHGRTWTMFRWRPLLAKPVRWSPMTEWAGPKPKGLWRFFAKYKPHMQIAMTTETEKAAALTRMPRVASGATVESARRDFLAA